MSIPGYDQWKLATPPHYEMTDEEERQMELARECQSCDGFGRVEVFRAPCALKGVCECGLCPEVEDCPECVGQIECDETES